MSNESEPRVDMRATLPLDVRQALEQVIDYVIAHEERDFWENCVWQDEIRATNPQGERNLRDSHVYRHAWVLRRWLWGRHRWERSGHPPAPPASVVLGWESPSSTSSPPENDES